MALPKVQGVYLMPSFGRYEVACEVLKVVARLILFATSHHFKFNRVLYSDEITRRRYFRRHCNPCAPAARLASQGSDTR